MAACTSFTDVNYTTQSNLLLLVTYPSLQWRLSDDKLIHAAIARRRQHLRRYFPTLSHLLDLHMLHATPSLCCFRERPMSSAAGFGATSDICDCIVGGMHLTMSPYHQDWPSTVSVPPAGGIICPDSQSLALATWAPALVTSSDALLSAGPSLLSAGPEGKSSARLKSAVARSC